jgi:hypothetical protein
MKGEIYMKKLLGIGALVLSLGIGSMLVYADTDKPLEFVSPQDSQGEIQDRENWFKERMGWRKNQVKEALEDGLITEEQSKKWEEHFTYMEKFHSENGFMPGGCHGNGMMRGSRWNR